MGNTSFYNAGIPGVAAEVAKASDFAEQASSSAVSASGAATAAEGYRDEAEGYRDEAQAAAAEATASNRVITLDTVADMVAAPYLQVGHRVETARRLSGVDGGGSVYEIGSGFGSADNFGHIFDLDNGLQARALFPGGRANIRQFGAVGDGVADDSSPFEAASIYAEATDTPLHLPAGVYLLSDCDTAGASLYGDGPGTILKDGGSTTYMLDDSSTNEVAIADLTLDGGGTTTANAVRFNLNPRVLLQNVNAKDWGGRGVFFEQAVSNVTIEGGFISGVTGADFYVFKSHYNIVTGVQFDNCAEHVVRFGRFNSDTDTASGRYCVVSSCIFNQIGNDAVLFELDSGFGTVANCSLRNSRSLIKAETSDPNGPAQRIFVIGNICDGAINEASACIKLNSTRNCLIQGNLVSGFDTGITVGEHSVIDGNIFQNIVSNAIRTDSDYMVITGNRIISSTGNGINHTGSYSVINDNSVTNCDADGISLADGINNSVSGNTLSACDVNLSLSSTATDNIITGNHSTAPASSHLVNSGANNAITNNVNIEDGYFNGEVSGGVISVLPSYKFANVDTEGAAATDNLNGINGGTPGQVLVLQSTNTVTRDVTVKHGINNIELSGGADFTLADTQDTITLVYNGSNWCEIARSDN